MNLIPGSPTWLVVVLFAALAAGAIEDFIRLRISNITSAIVFVTALIAIGLHGFSIDLWQNAAVFLFLLIAGTILFSTGKFGGGDVKFFAAVGLWVDINAGIWLLATTLIAGGVLALIYIAVRVSRGQHFGKKYKSKGIPYGIAIAVGASLIFAGQFGLLKSKPAPSNPLAIPLG